MRANLTTSTIHTRETVVAVQQHVAASTATAHLRPEVCVGSRTVRPLKSNHYRTNAESVFLTGAGVELVLVYVLYSGIAGLTLCDSRVTYTDSLNVRQSECNIHVALAKVRRIERSE